MYGPWWQNRIVPTPMVAAAKQAVNASLLQNLVAQDALAARETQIQRIRQAHVRRELNLVRDIARLSQQVAHQDVRWRLYATRFGWYRH